MTGDGLFARYYNTKNLTEVKTVRIDPTIDFMTWGAGAPPDTTVGADNFSVRWTGKIKPLVGGDYTFYLTVDDGVRLWIDGVQRINQWVNQNVEALATVPITLTANQLHDIRLEYFENTTDARVKLEWSRTGVANRVVVPQDQLYSNPALIGDRVWLDNNGNGRQDDGEPGVANTRVRILEADTGEDAVLFALTDGTGKYAHIVPAGYNYKFQFGNPGTAYTFTMQNAPGAEPDKNSDTNETGGTSAFPVLANVADLTWDAGIRTGPVFDLDVNADGDLSDSVDGAANYLPGYEGNVAKVSEGTTFNTPVYKGQRMKLVLNGIGSSNATKVEFVIDSTTSIAGYASNRSDPTLEGQGKTHDFSFQRNGDGSEPGVKPTITIQSGQPASAQTEDHGGYYGGQMEASKTWVNFYCKDYGGMATVLAKITLLNGTETTMTLPVVRDTDPIPDGIADRWEIAMGKRWAAQYGVPEWTDAVALTKFNSAGDIELKDPDKVGTTAEGPLREQAEEGDAHTVQEEYRGYILDGGGLNGAGANVHGGGHIRLDPARKEILVEVDRAAVVNNIPESGLKGVLNGASGVFSNATRGAGIYMYWLMDNEDLDLPKDKVDASNELVNALGLNRNVQLMTDFIHLLFIDEGVSAAVDVGGPAKTPAVSVNRATTSGFQLKGINAIKARGSVVALTDFKNILDITVTPLIDEARVVVVAHELTHQLIEKNTNGFDAQEHTNADQTDLLYAPTNRKNLELLTVKFTAVVQTELYAKTGEWGTL